MLAVMRQSMVESLCFETLEISFRKGLNGSAVIAGRRPGGKGNDRQGPRSLKTGYESH